LEVENPNVSVDHMLKPCAAVVGLLLSLGTSPVLGQAAANVAAPLEGSVGFGREQ
jgi:hypothetical protein